MLTSCLSLPPFPSSLSFHSALPPLRCAAVQSHPLAADLLKSSKRGESKVDGDASSAAYSSSGVRYSAVRQFAELPLSGRTQRALTENGFTRMTDIQRAAIPHALAGRDVLGAARTGSGKTLAFLIPVLERLWRLRWGRLDGLGALIVAPTRELALQIFDVLRLVGVQHTLSAGLVIGGKSVEEEQARIHAMNLLVCTPGRLLQHLEQTYAFDVSNVRVLVLDEADRILDLGFRSALDAILAALPAQRQTLLFSATQTKSVRDLARLSLSSPEYLAVHEQDVLATPDKLEQHYVVVEAQAKLDLLFSFIKTHLRSKTIVFLTACKQVRFLYEMFRRVRPGVPLLHLHGKMNQRRRMELYYHYCQHKEAVLFATDIAARGLDFPDVDWIVQMDAPDSVQTYIHRVGRTARYRAGGKALLFLCPSEAPLVEKIAASKVEVRRTRVNPSQLRSIATAFQAFMVEDAELKYLGQKALLAYLRAVYLQSDKDVFDLAALDVHALAVSMGLPSAPKLSIALSKKGAQKEKNVPYALRELEQGAGKTRQTAKDERGMHDMDRLLRRKNQGVLSDARMRMLHTDERGEGDEDDDEDDDVLTVKSRAQEVESDDEDAADEQRSLIDLPDAARRLPVTEENGEGDDGDDGRWLEHLHDSLAAEDAADKRRERERSDAPRAPRSRALSTQPLLTALWWLSPVHSAASTRSTPCAGRRRSG